MNTTELLAATVLSGFVPDSSPDYDSARLLIELTDVLQEVFAKSVITARQGFWLQQQLTAVTSGQSLYRIPHRAVTGGLEKLQAVDSGGRVRHLVYADLKQAYLMENYGPGEPTSYVILGDQVQLLPKPSVSGWNLRFTFYVRPSRLVAVQAAGRVTAVNTTARTITVSAIPNDQTTAASIVSGTTLIDCVHPNGWHELSLLGAAQTWSGTTITVTDTQDMSRIIVGDYVRAADQTDWPCLPDEFHRSLADAAAAVYLLNTGQAGKAQLLGSKVQSDIQRLEDMLSPRVKDSPRILKPSYGILRRPSRLG